MPPMPIQDAAFLLAEARERPMHVGGLQLFEYPEGAGSDFLVDLFDQTVRQADPKDVHPLFRRRPHRGLSTLGQWGWEVDDELDLEYHVRHSALPPPGRIRELLSLVSRMHGTLLDRNRPLWEASLIQGLTDADGNPSNQFAIYTKIHHALLDGVAAARFMQDTLTEDPDERDMPAPWSAPLRKEKSGGPIPSPTSVVSGVLNAAGATIGVGRALVKAAQDAFQEHVTSLPFQAPPSMFNVPITGARRFAADSWELDRIKAVRAATGATLNDVVMAMCAGALRSYLQEQNALPEQDLVAMVPVALRPSDQAGEGGNAVGMILCNLATGVEDAGERLQRVMTSMKQGKERLQGLTPTQIIAISALTMAPMLLGAIAPTPRPPFNVTISNVPGPRKPLYFNGAKLVGSYPLSIPADGQALNITCLSYVDKLEFGLTACRTAVPHMQRLLGYLEDSLVSLEKAAA